MRKLSDSGKFISRSRLGLAGKVFEDSSPGAPYRDLTWTDKPRTDRQVL